jgi:polyisoprenoid-binding protein YceI
MLSKALLLVLATATALGTWFVTPTTAQEHSIDIAHSVLKIRVYKTGILSAFAHDHEIVATISDGTVLLSPNPSVSLAVHARTLQVIDPGVSSADRTQIQRTMEGPDVLDIERFPEVSFQSNAIERKSEQHWVVRGNLTLHGQKSPVEANVVFRDNRYQGFAQIRQSDFGMTPVSIAGGTIKVKNEVRIEFDVALKP